MAEPIRVTVDEDLLDIIPGYLDGRRADVATIRSLVEAGDFEQARVLGHRMKGSGGGYGFEAITEIGLRIEMAAKSAEGDAILAALDALADFLDRVEITAG